MSLEGVIPKRRRSPLSDCENGRHDCQLGGRNPSGLTPPGARRQFASRADRKGAKGAPSVGGRVDPHHTPSSPRRALGGLELVPVNHAVGVALQIPAQLVPIDDLPVAHRKVQ